MVGVATVALIERKPTISRSLFSRYWRDVHGVMAARIPGFESYTQYHVAAASHSAAAGAGTEGIAVVTYASEADREGLLTSEITRHIHRDEANVFRRALLYNLGADDWEELVAFDHGASLDVFFVVPASQNARLLIDDLIRADVKGLCYYNLAAGDPAAWNDTDVDDGRGERWVAMLHARFATLSSLENTVADAGDCASVYVAEGIYRMVEGGRPTPIGLRGLDAVNTITEAGAANQLEDEVVAAIYGQLGRQKAIT